MGESGFMSLYKNETIGPDIRHERIIIRPIIACAKSVAVMKISPFKPLFFEVTNYHKKRGS